MVKLNHHFELLIIDKNKNKTDYFLQITIYGTRHISNDKLIEPD
jgi:hypothetical protein